MRKLLIVSPHFPPSNAADMHRVRAVIPFLRDFGWDPTVLAVTPQSVHVPHDSWLSDGIPSDIPVHRAQPLGLKWSRVPGLGTIDFRAMGALRRRGLQLLTEEQFDLVYFSTTAFAIHVLGPAWKRKTGVPFVMDYQDPWVSDYYHNNPHITPPGGHLKYRVIDRIHRYQEPRVLRECSGLTSVSPAYPEQLRNRYSWLPEIPEIALQFPVATRDFDRIRQSSQSQSVFDAGDGRKHWVYVGRGGEDMAKSVSAFFIALKRWKTRNPDEHHNVRVHFIGTSYAKSGRGRKTIQPLAEQHGVGDIVSESTDRIPFSEMLRCLLDASALIVPGSDDSGYTASKLLPYLLAGKPVLTIFHHESPAAPLVARVGGAQLVTFQSNELPDDIAKRVHDQWFTDCKSSVVIPVNPLEIQTYTDEGQAAQLGRFFDSIVMRQVQRKAA